MTAPHPLARLRFQSCRVPAANLIGASGEGFKIAMRNLDIFRSSVAAAALGFARRALDEALVRVTTRKMFGQTLGDFQLTQAALADMATEIDGAALLTYRAAWLRDVEGVSTTREAAMAKMAATEGAQRVIDRAVQMFGGLGVSTGSVVDISIGKFGRSASMRGRPRSRSSSLAATCSKRETESLRRDAAYGRCVQAPARIFASMKPEPAPVPAPGHVDAPTMYKRLTGVR